MDNHEDCLPIWVNHNGAVVTSGYGGRLLKFEFYELENQHSSFGPSQSATPVKIGRDITICKTSPSSDIAFANFYLDVQTHPNLGVLSINIDNIESKYLYTSRVKSIPIE